MLVNKAVFPHMKADGGAIINFASQAGVRGEPGSGHYAASKAAVIAWTRTIADEWGPRGIRANVVAPAVWTPMYDDFRQALNQDELADHDQQLRRVIPLGGKLGDPRRDLAPALVFLASDASRFITGQTLAVDGGFFKVH
jgi:NAD(P)-dependent dehydrogenase (short-subunit alcohol dehydrogenase family)